MILSGTIILVAIIEARIEMKVCGDEFGDGEMDLILPFPDVIVKVAEPVHAVCPSDLLANLPRCIEGDVGTERSLLVLLLVDAEVRDKFIIVDIHNFHGKGGNVELSRELLLLAPCYFVLHIGGNRNFQRRHNLRRDIIGVPLIIGCNLSLHYDQ